jgi:integrase
VKKGLLDPRSSWHAGSASGTSGDSEEVTGMKARAGYYFRKERDCYVVYLHWGKAKNGKRKTWKRHTFDDEGTPLVHEVLAKKLADRINADIVARGSHFDPRRWFNRSDKEMQFRSYAEAWLDKQTHLAPSYIGDVRRAIVKYCVPFLGTMHIATIRKRDIIDFLDWLPNRLAAKTKKNILGVLRKLLSDAWRREDIPRVPPFPRISVPESEIKWLSSEVQAKVIAAMPKQHRPIFRFMAYFGCRPGEARALQWEDIDWENKVIAVKRTFSGSELRPRTKTGRIKYLPITDEVEEFLKPIRGLGGFVFRNEYGKPYRKQRLQSLWKQAREKVGAPEVTLYQGVRHSKGCQLINEKDADLEHVRELLGHSRSDMTRKYARVSTGKLRRLLE